MTSPTKDQALAVVFVSNGPGELTTWVRPLAEQLHRCLLMRPRAPGSLLSLRLVLVPCPNATGTEASALASTSADVGDCSVLGGTLDDALGEAYDKAARMLHLSSETGGGPALEKAALQGNATAIDLPVPMKKRKDCDFSYAGLKNALRGRVAETVSYTHLTLPTNREV